MAFPPGNMGWSPNQLALLRQRGRSHQDIPLPIPVPMGGTGGETVTDAQTNLGVLPGTDVQEFNQNLQHISDLENPVSDKILGFDSGSASPMHVSIGTNLSIDGTTLNKTGGGGGGITQIDTGFGLTGGPITSTGTISLDGSVSNGVPIAIWSVVKKDRYEALTGGYSNIPDFSIPSITPKSSSSKFLIFGTMNLSYSSNNSTLIGLFRDNTQIGRGDAGGARSRCSSYSFISGSNKLCTPFSFTFFDEPSTVVPFNYSIKWKGEPTNTCLMNAGVVDNDTNQYARTASSLVVVEII